MCWQQIGALMLTALWVALVILVAVLIGSMFMTPQRPRSHSVRRIGEYPPGRPDRPDGGD